MRFPTTAIIAFALAAGCGTDKAPEEAAPAGDEQPAAEKQPDVKAETRALLAEYNEEYAALEKKQNLAYWKASISGKKEDWDASAEAELALKKLHSDKQRYAQIAALLEKKDELDPTDARALKVAYLAFKGNQLPDEMLEKLVKDATEIQETFNNFRAELDGEKLTNNDLLERLAKETRTAEREKIWQALKQVGGAVGPKLVALAKLRNEAARSLGYRTFWEMQIDLQEHVPGELLTIFAELEKLTDEPFAKMKAELDAELAKRFKVKPDQMMPWHYDNPFFQEAPPSAAVDLDEFYKDKAKEDIAELARKFYADIGLPIDAILERSDLYEKEGKDQHAYCMSVDRSGDVRTLLNVKPNCQWMGTMLHEEGHAIYDTLIDRELPYNLREPAHIFTTEAVAMLFGALAQNPAWMVAYAGADEKRIAEVEQAILEQRRREQLIFARWTMVMLHFEKAMYEDPDQDLNTLWWDMVEKYQGLTRPADRNEPDWAAKPHFTIAPVYYHNYQLGELFAAQLRAKLAKLAAHEGPTRTLSFNGRKDFGEFLRREVFAPGKRVTWPEFIEKATGEPLTAKYFARELI